MSRPSATGRSETVSLDNRPIYTGGCQCGAVRFRVEGALGDASVCHCRMCQKAFGNFYAALVSRIVCALECERSMSMRCWFMRAMRSRPNGVMPPCSQQPTPTWFFVL